MILPRWTTYPALATVAVLLLTAVPKPVPTRPASGAAAKVMAGEGATSHPRLVVLGIDGLDPEILAGVIARHPRGHEELFCPDRRWGRCAFPWDFYSTTEPGGLVEFHHRPQPRVGTESLTLFTAPPQPTRPIPSTVTESAAGHVSLPGSYRFPTSSGGDSNRTGRAFWDGSWARQECPLMCGACRSISR